MSWQRSEKPSNDEVVKNALPLKTLRLVDIIDRNIPALFDEFYHLPNVEVLHSSLEDPKALKDADCLVIPIFSNVFRITPILRAVNGLLSPSSPAPSIIDQLKALFNRKSFNGILSPNQILKIKVSIPSCSLSYLLAVTIWKNDEAGSTPAAVTEVSITDAFQAVFNFIHEHNCKVEKEEAKYKKEKLIQTLISPFFSTAGITVKQGKAAELMSSVYQTYLRANKIPITRARSPPGEELNFALKEGTIGRSCISPATTPLTPHSSHSLLIVLSDSRCQ
jgi:hypothetical protein